MYGIIKKETGELLTSCLSLTEVEDIFSAYGESDYEIKRMEFFPIERSIEKRPCRKDLEYEMINDINFELGEHILIAGDIQGGKLRIKLKIILHLLLTKKMPVLLLFRNFNTDYFQFLKRLTEFNEEQRSKGLPTIPVPYDILSQQDRLCDLFRGPALVLGLANPKTFTIVQSCLDDHRDLINRLCIIIDEADLVTFELREERTKTENCLDALFPNLYLLISVTGTPASILLCDKMSQIYVLEKAKNYYGIDRIKHHPLEPKRSSKANKQYEPELDKENLALIMQEILNLPSATLLLLPSRLTNEHKDVIHFLSQEYKNTSKDLIFMELNEKSVKVYNKYATCIEEISGKMMKAKPVGAIDKALQKYKTTTHIVIVSGTLAGRGVSFVSSDYSRHLSHQYIAGSPNTHLETGLQSVRLLGRYEDNPQLTLYCSQELYDELIAQQNDMANFLSLAKNCRDNKESLPKIIDLQHDYNRQWFSPRKTRNTTYKQNNSKWRMKKYELYVDEYNVEEDNCWFDAIINNLTRSFSDALLKDTWPAGGAWYAKKERVIYCNPLHDFTEEGIQKYVKDTSKGKKMNKNTAQNLINNGYKFLNDVKKLYEKYPHYEGKIIRRRFLDTKPSNSNNFFYKD